MQGGIPEEVTEVLKQLQQLIRRVLEHGNDLRGHHVVHDEERGLGREAEVTRRARVGKLSLPSPHISPQTLSKFLHSTGESYILTLIHSPIGMPQCVPNYPPLSCDYLRKLNGLPIFQPELDATVFSSSLSSTKSETLSQVPNLIFIPADKMISDPVLADHKLLLPLRRYIIFFPSLISASHRDEPF